MQSPQTRAISRFTSVTRLGALAMLAISGTTVADEVNFNLNDDAASVAYAHRLASPSLRIDGGWLHHQDNGDVGHVGVHLAGDASSGSAPIDTGIGGKLLFADADRANANGGALAIGGYFRYALPAYNRIAIGGQIYFAPDVTSFGDVSQYTEISLFGGYNILRDADLYLGLRNVKVDVDGGGDATIDTGLHAGFTLRF